MAFLLLSDLFFLLISFLHRYISRANPRDTSRHSILGTQWYKPKELASQMNLNLSNGWGIVRTVVDLVRNSKESMEKFVLVKDPNKVS